MTTAIETSEQHAPLDIPHPLASQPHPLVLTLTHEEWAYVRVRARVAGLSTEAFVLALVAEDNARDVAAFATEVRTATEAGFGRPRKSPRLHRRPR